MTFESRGKSKRLFPLISTSIGLVINCQFVQCVFEDKFIARDSGTLEQLKEITSRRRVIEESINETSSITDAIAREMSGGLSSHTQQVLICQHSEISTKHNYPCHELLCDSNT